MKIAITGGGGQLAGAFLRVAGFFPELELRSFSREEWNIGEEEDFHSALRAFQPDLVLNTAAYTAVDKAEEETDLCYAVNSEAPALLARCCKDQGLGLVHFSTDYVFDGGNARPYKESDAPNPLNTYGKSKLLGETEVLRVHPKALVLRVSWLYDVGGRNFARTMLRAGSANSSLRIVCDQFSSPTYAGDLASDILLLASKENIPSGLLHYSQEGEASWADFAEAIFLGAGMNCEVQRIPTSDYPTAANRPLYSKLDNQQWLKLTGLPTKSWQQGLAGFFNDLNPK